MQPYLLQLASGKGPSDLLFGTTRRGGPKHRQLMWDIVRRICLRAGVPAVCTHSLRGLWATLAVQSGAASHVVAANLGHHSFAMTERHYAQGSAISNASTARVLGMLGNTRPSVIEQLEQLDEETLARLLGLLAKSNKVGAPTN